MARIKQNSAGRKATALKYRLAFSKLMAQLKLTGQINDMSPEQAQKLRSIEHLIQIIEIEAGIFRA